MIRYSQRPTTGTKQVHDDDHTSSAQLVVFKEFDVAVKTTAILDETERLLQSSSKRVTHGQTFGEFNNENGGHDVAREMPLVMVLP